VSQRRSDDGEFDAVSDVGDASFDGSPEDFDAFFLVGFVFFGAGGQFFPGFVGFSSGGVDVDDVFAGWAERFVEYRRNEEGAEVLGVLEGSVPVLW